MKSQLLLPHNYKKYGWMIFITALILVIYSIVPSGIKEPKIFNINVFQIIGRDRDFQNHIFGARKFFFFAENNIYEEIIYSFLIIGGFMVGFSKEKIEDELISHIRLESLLWSIYVNYAFFVLSMIFIYGIDFEYVWIFGIFGNLIIFIFRFNYIIWKNSKVMSNE